MDSNSMFPLAYVRQHWNSELTAKVTFHSLEDVENEMEFLANDMDTEYGHRNADDLLCIMLREHGYDELVSIFENMKKWYA